MTERPRPSEAGARGRANVGGATGGGLARGARGKGRAEERDGGGRCNGGHDLQSKRVSEIHGCSRSCDSRCRDEANITSSPANRITRGVSRRSEIQAVMRVGSQKIT